MRDVNTSVANGFERVDILRRQLNLIARHVLLLPSYRGFCLGHTDCTRRLIGLSVLRKVSYIAISRYTLEYI